MVMGQHFPYNYKTLAEKSFINYAQQSYPLKIPISRWRVGLVIKNTGYFSVEPGFDSQNPYSGYNHLYLQFQGI